ncbi:MAG: Glycine cleavage system H protein [bacterium ADurb.Bin431]|nr:MAG: Glycine cleavage system H protein [bacterium ADurb.Bin431]HOC25495.1 glycine cleavage system protein GcvH [bacterium]HOY44539.1 glycine cleavage system protein GcvH [bacterium]HPG82238.1 glycine cleavage system protein GcvH [bacterium]HPM58508.1 glycine cleavage system protein GcvH [bacterium]
MTVPEDLLYTNEHEWVRVEGDVAVVGITDYAQGELGDVVFVELPAVGTAVKQADAFGTIEAVKAVSDLFAPASGEVVEVNPLLTDAPETVNKDPYGEGWMVKVRLSSAGELANLLKADAYKQLVG